MLENSIPGGTSGSDPTVVVVSTGELALAEHPSVLLTPALGSCVGVAVWDAARRRGALAHVMLPSPANAPQDGNPDRFASVAVPKMIALLGEGLSLKRFVAKIAGGAAMFKGDTQMASIGDRNVEEVKRQLGLLKVPVIAEDTGGSHARTMEFHLDTGLVIVRSYLYGIREL
ncbi:chemotaxis protein CheD [Coriobacteriia bacterium Es71-Z0120]|uniref:chemotaxis protein CheD n=1 Tax=Parvivirga hydrogeniphila TaxID=2939460 RepID=UPI002260B9CD|nr:chemotaxis protein CheD [Parvivirga hydrogeniphila]MCL4078475.1 chemotaxis protein CheD [Parvivirga hydrogeniphila]